jgi:hypothetical protein
LIDVWLRKIIIEEENKKRDGLNYDKIYICADTLSESKQLTTFIKRFSNMRIILINSDQDVNKEVLKDLKNLNNYDIIMI